MAQQENAGGQDAVNEGGEPRELGLGDLTSLLSAGPDMMLQALAMLIDGIGTGTEWTGDQVARLGELQQQLADKIADLGGGDEQG
jgi:hypothetical protein